MIDFSNPVHVGVHSTSLNAGVVGARTGVNADVVGARTGGGEQILG